MKEIAWFISQTLDVTLECRGDIKSIEVSLDSVFGLLQKVSFGNVSE